MVTEDNYENLRSIEGCENLTDFPATKTDSTHINAIADALGVESENRYVYHSPSLEVLKKTRTEIRAKSRKLTVEGKKHMILVYMGGHGATLNEK